MPILQKSLPRDNNPNSSFQILEEDGTDLFENELSNGVYCYIQEYNKNTKTYDTKPVKICSLCYIDGKLNAEQNIYYRFVYFDRDTPKQAILSSADLFGGVFNNRKIKELVNTGLIINEKRESLFIEYLKTQAQVVEELPATNNTGWNKNHDYIGNGFNTSDVIYTGSNDVFFEKYGDAKAQKTFLRQVYIENPLVFFVNAYCVAGFFAKYLLPLETNFLLAITGMTSKGKTKSANLAKSLYTHPAEIASLNATKGALESLMKKHNDNFHVLDETHESELTPQEKVSAIYAIANGRTKARLHQTNDSAEPFSASKPKPLKYSVLFTGEEAILNNIRRTGGQNVRYNELVLSNDLVLWQSIETSDEMEEIEFKMSQNYGHIIPEILTKISKELKANPQHLLDKFNAYLRGYRSSINADSALINRKAKMLAYTAVGAEYLYNSVFGEDEEEYNVNEFIDESIYVLGTSALFANIADLEDSDGHEYFRNLLQNIEVQQQAYFILDGSADDDNIAKKEIFGYIEITSTHKKIKILSTQKQAFFTRLGVSESNFLKYLDGDNHLKMILLKRGKDGKTTIATNGKRYLWLEIPKTFFDDVEKPKEEQQKTIPKIEKQASSSDDDGFSLQDIMSMETKYGNHKE